MTLLCNVTTEHWLHLSLPKQIQRLFFLGPPSGKTEANRRGTERTAPNSRARARIATPIPPRVARGRRGRRPPVCRRAYGRPCLATGGEGRRSAAAPTGGRAWPAGCRGAPPRHSAAGGRAWPSRPCCGRPRGAGPPSCHRGRPPGRRRGRAACAA